MIYYECKLHAKYVRTLNDHQAIPFGQFRDPLEHLPKLAVQYEFVMLFNLNLRVESNELNELRVRNCLYFLLNLPPRLQYAVRSSVVGRLVAQDEVDAC